MLRQMVNASIQTALQLCFQAYIIALSAFTDLSASRNLCWDTQLNSEIEIKKSMASFGRWFKKGYKLN